MVKDIDRERLKAEITRRRKLLGLSPRALSIKATGKPDAVRHIMSDKSRHPRADTLAAIARALGTTVDILLGHQSASAADARLISAEVVGQVETLAFRAYPWFKPSERYAVAVPDDDRYRDQERIVFRVHDHAMDNKYGPGSYLICIRACADDVLINDYVVVNNWRRGYAETLCRQVRESGGLLWLWPNSTDPELQEPLKWRPVERLSASEDAAGFEAAPKMPATISSSSGLADDTPPHADGIEIVAIVVGSYIPEVRSQSRDGQV